jgi:hypothetical protein
MKADGFGIRYFVKAIGWARKYGLRILLDFHALPGEPPKYYLAICLPFLIALYILQINPHPFSPS